MVCIVWVLSDSQGLKLSANGVSLNLQGLGPRISSGWTSLRAYLSLFVLPRLAWWIP